MMELVSSCSFKHRQGSRHLQHALPFVVQVAVSSPSLNEKHLVESSPALAMSFSPNSCKMWEPLTLCGAVP